MSVLIGHASIDETGRASGGQAGDQTGKEVYVGYWYNGNWNVVLRPKSPAVAEKMAASCETLCKGNLVGYDQGDRNTLWDGLELVNWNPEKLKEPCETDCSQLMASCARCAGLNIPRVALGGGRYNAPVTQTMRSAFSSTGAFEVLTDPKYLTSDKYLKRGDILLRESGHTAMALSNGDAANESEATLAASASVNTLKVGDIVKFKGGKQYASATAITGPTVKAGPAKITALAPGKLHPVHLIHTDSTSGVYGWVSAADIESGAATVKTHTIVYGDTLWGISRNYGVTLTALCEANSIKSTDFIHPGQTLKIPS